MRHLYKHTPELILVIYIGLFLGFKDIDQRWDRAINSDGKGYYAYLPAIFIYDDLQYRFVENYEWQYYPENRSVFKEFRQPAGNGVVNKCFPGMAILWLPFFLIAHLLAWLELYPRDGYSFPYQMMIAISAIWFLWKGAKWLFRLLESAGATDKTASFITLVVTLGTNLIFFTIVEGSMSHVYSFALITGFALTGWKMFHEYNRKWFIRTLAVYTLIILVRPTNAMVILILPFLAGSKQTFSMTFKRIVADRITLIRGIIPSLALLSIPFILWYLQTGSPVVYTYGEEKLDLLRPHMLSILFSFNRGWLVYTPVALVSLAGLAGLYRKNRMQFFSLLGFLFIFVYVLSSWWIWYYASKCGQRVFIDIYVVVGLLLFYLYDAIKGTLWKGLLSALLTLLVFLNIFQFWQHANWIYPPYTITSAIFRDVFFKTHPSATVYLPDDGIAHQVRFINDMEQDRGALWMNPLTRNDSSSFNGKWSSKTNLRIPYSVGLEVRSDTLFRTDIRIVRVQAWVFSKRIAPEASLVFDFQSEGKSVSYNPLLIRQYVRMDEWTKVEAACYVPAGLPEGWVTKVYFFNPSKHYDFYVDDLVVEFLSMKDGNDYRSLDGVLKPNQ